MSRFARRFVGSVFGMLAIAVLIGCGNVTTEPSRPTETPSGPKKGIKTAKVEAKEVSADALADAIKEYRGTVVYVDFWALSCVPCVAGFPHFVDLHQKHADKGLTCVSVSMDMQDGEDYKRDNVLKFLTEKNATFPNFIVIDPENAGDKLRETFGKGAGIPYSVLFDRAGKRIGDTKPDNPTKLTLAELDKKIEEELVK